MRINTWFRPSVIVLAVAIYASAVLWARDSAKVEKQARILAASEPQNLALVTVTLDTKKVDRVKVLEKFLEDIGSPLKPNAETFVKVADKYGLDYRLLPAIACMESTCGKKIIPESHNPFGWGIYGNTVTRFESFDKAIETVGKGLADNYVSKGFTTVSEIAPIYTPPNHVNWLHGVNYFIGRIEMIEGQA